MQFPKRTPRHVTEMTDDAVEGYLAANHPEVLKEFKLAEEHNRIQQRRELLESEISIPIQSIVSRQTEIRSKPHWAEEVFAKSGLEEICSLVKPHLPEIEYTIFCQSLVEAMEQSEIAEEHNIHRSKVVRILKRVRRTIMSKIKKGDLVLPYEVEVATEQDEVVGTYIQTYRPRFHDSAIDRFTGEINPWWMRLMCLGHTIYHKPPAKPPVKALVCDCGHHFNAEDLDHHRGKYGRVYNCPYCKKRWPKEKWAEILR